MKLIPPPLPPQDPDDVPLSEDELDQVILDAVRTIMNCLDGKETLWGYQFHGDILTESLARGNSRIEDGQVVIWHPIKGEWVSVDQFPAMLEELTQETVRELDEIAQDLRELLTAEVQHHLRVNLN